VDEIAVEMRLWNRGWEGLEWEADNNGDFRQSAALTFKIERLGQLCVDKSERIVGVIELRELEVGGHLWEWES